MTSKLETGNVAVGKNLKVPKVYAIIQSWDHGHQPEQLPCLAFDWPKTEFKNLKLQKCFTNVPEKIPEVTSWQWLAIYGVIPVVF